MMRKAILVVAVLLVVAIFVVGYPGYVPKPALNGSGPLAVRLGPEVQVPEYHSPLGWWQLHHMDVLNRGDFTQADCLKCHEPQSSCNSCHSYVGVKEIVR
jgi:hypothetical protein